MSPLGLRPGARFPERSAGSAFEELYTPGSGVRTLMALFGFNKQKVLATAEKYVQQGKLQNAISEYEKVLKNDSKDLTVTNTVGDLYSRLGRGRQSHRVLQERRRCLCQPGFHGQGHRDVQKDLQAQPSLESLLKLAELYTQQGLFNDARAQYLQVAEEFLKAGRTRKRGPHLPEDSGDGSGKQHHADPPGRSLCPAGKENRSLANLHPPPPKACAPRARSAPPKKFCSAC